MLLDAVIVINAHEKGYWESLYNAHQICLPGTIIENELHYFTSDRGKEHLSVVNLLKENKILRIDAEISHIQKLTQKISDDFMKGLDPGELEALAILLSKEHQNLLFSTADKAAIKTLGLLGLSTRGISVEELLNTLHGIQNTKKKLESQYTKQWFQKILAEGFAEQHLWLKK